MGSPQLRVHQKDRVRRRLLFGLGLGAGACSGGGEISGWHGRGRTSVSPPNFAGVKVDVLGGESLVESRQLPGDFDLLYNHDTRADLSCHHFQCLEGLFKVSTGESNEETIVGDSEFVAGLAATLEKAPLELSDESSETSRGGVYKLELVLDVALRVYAEER